MDRPSFWAIDFFGFGLTSRPTHTINIILTDKSIHAACSNLVRESATREPSYTDARSTDRNSKGTIIV